MVDHSELPFRLLCRKYGAHAAYTPMLHAWVFNENPRYRSREFSTCKEDRPLFVQFCANNPDVLLEAAQRVEPYCDYVVINLGCPQNFAKQGNYGAYLMSNLPLIKSLVVRLAQKPGHSPVKQNSNISRCARHHQLHQNVRRCGLFSSSCTWSYNKPKDQKTIRANWEAIKAVRNSMVYPSLLMAIYET